MFPPGSQGCSFPESWRGKWFQNGLGDVEIRAHSISHIGHCKSFDGHKKYLLLNRQDMCFICLVFTPQHHNLVQYKQSFCVMSNHIEEVCDMITGDFTLNTMVKVPGVPIPCPFQGHYSFSYTNGSEVKCNDPPSSFQACADSSRFLFHHRKCHHVANTNDKIESFQCLATWDNGVDHYLYGRFTGPGLTAKESQYRCFMYSLYGTNGYMSMTADATCQGLQSPSLGMNVYNLRHKTDEMPQQRCHLPDFFATIPEWQDVSGRQKFIINSRLDGFRVMDILDPYVVINDSDVQLETKLRVTCARSVTPEENGYRKSVEILAYIIDDKCESNYHCVRLTHRTDKVIELQIGQSAELSGDACNDSYFQSVIKHILLPIDSPTTPCPMTGVYSYMQKNSDCTGQLDVGCSSRSEIVVNGKCPGGESADVLQCYANWTESDRIYVIAGRVGDLRKAADCLTYRVTVKGYELEADPMCGSERLNVLGQPVGFILKSPSKKCSATTTRPAPVYPAQSQESRNQKGTYDSSHSKSITSGEIIETHGSSGRKASGVINANNRGPGLPSSLFPIIIVVLLNALIAQR
ncbi:hypothetical protein BsWGS_19745 [Bradybaena similaris]